jgi:predicted Ser/Thr protein kinase
MPDNPHSSNTVSDDKPPEYIAHYRILRRLGKGGMGEVLLGEDTKQHGRKVALKVLPEELTRSESRLRRFRQEARAILALNHPNILTVYEIGEAGEKYYIATEYIEGETLRQCLWSEPLKLDEALGVAIQVAMALEAAHAAGIVHRDLKPDNILLERRPDGSLHAKVVDFGIARVTGSHGGTIADASQPLTSMGAVIGTPGYMAPEQATGGQIDFRVDLYALGVILWECCTGQPLWESESLSQLLIAQLTRTPPKLFPDLAPPPLATLIDQLLTRAPAERPATALAVRDALRRLVATGIGAAEMPRAAALPDKSPPTGPNADGKLTVAEAAQAGRSRPLVWLGTATLLGLVLIVATRGEDTPGEPATKPSAAGTRAKAEVKSAKRGELPARRVLLEALPDAYVEHGRALLLSTDRDERVAAGKAIAAAEGDARAKIPAYFHQIAAFEMADDCGGRQAILREIEAADDLRVLWALRNLKELPRDACKGRDCLGCLRDDLDRVTEQFESAVNE